MHSVLNILSVLSTSMYYMGALVGDAEIFEPNVTLTVRFARDLSNRDLTLRRLRDIASFENDFLSSIENGMPPGTPSKEFEAAMANVRNILSVLRIRAAELVRREEYPDAWEDFNIRDLHEDFSRVFSAIALNSQGRFGIVENLARRTPSDYVISLRIDSVDGDHIRIPPVFKDVMRDLIANARKYSPPGSVIVAGLRDDGNTIRFVVHDEGIGIPPEEILSIGQPGFRASNASNRRTHGEGLGVAKALITTRRHGGHIWVDSAPGAGTEVTVEIPRPKRGFSLDLR